MKRILSALILVSILLAFVSCGKESSVPNGMKWLNSTDSYIVYVPERWVIDDKELFYAHSIDYRLSETKAHYASVQVFDYEIDTTIEEFVNSYIGKMKSEFSGDFNNDAPIDYNGNEREGKSLTYSIVRPEGRMLCKSTFIVHNELVIELRYSAMDIEDLYTKNITDYNMIVENISLK